MRRLSILPLTVLLGLGAMVSCLEGTGDDTGQTPVVPLIDRLGGEAGITEVVNDFVARVLDDPAINGYFLNAEVDGNRLVTCLVRQIANVAGDPEMFPYPDDSIGCRDMATAHAGMGISTADFNDLVGHLSDALFAAGLVRGDVDAILRTLGGLQGDIVEDSGDNASVYQRVGRKPAIGAVIDLFVGEVVADSRINAFFTGLNGDAVARLKTCLVRQVCGATGGPCAYGSEVEHPSEPGVSAGNQCKSMMASHTGLGISIADFNALVEDLVTVLDAAGVATEDRDAIVAALGPLCPQIVAGGTGCS